MYYVDYHTHSSLSSDSSAPLERMAEAAVRAGLDELCVTDHYDLVGDFGEPVEEPCDWAAALAQLEAVRAQYKGRLLLRLGVEFGSATADHDKALRTLAEPRLDFVAGSLHNLTPEAGGKDFYFVNYTSSQVCYDALDDYFAHMLRLAPLPYYDALSHLIYPLRYMCMRDGQTVTLDGYRDRIRDILQIVAQTGRALELNTYNGQTLEDWRSVLELYRQVGGELVTVGSDAHTPGDVGRGVREGYALLSSLGFRYVTLYEKRRPRPVKL